MSAGAPLTFWKSVLVQYKKMPETLAGAFFIFLLVSELDAEEEHLDSNDAGLRNDIIEMVLKSRSLRKVHAYEDIARIAQGPIFGRINVSSNNGVEGYLQSETQGDAPPN